MAEKKKMMESAAPAADKKKALETAMAQIEKTYGKGAIMRLGTNTRVVVESIPTGSVALDLALGIGGVPGGGSLRSMGRNPPAKPPWPCTSRQRPRSGGARWPSSTRSTLWTPPMPGPWGWTLIIC